uniref:Prokineticin domain-containing protein n=1 Tax=Xenopus tropicalis TaxID=8364 RepID=A0A6I8Q3P6_XENTR
MLHVGSDWADPVGPGGQDPIPAGSSPSLDSLKACEKDQQCGGGMCCAVSIWIRSLRMCTPLGNEGDDCHPLSHKIPFFGKRMHHTCPCLPNLACAKLDDNVYKCLPLIKNKDFYF